MIATLGKANRKPVTVDLVKLVDTRMLIQANSGGGKSWLFRLLAESAAGKVQTIILDPEGEFSTLREKVDMLLVGEEGEVSADVRSSKLLARKLIELRISAVIDLYELKLSDRRKYVRYFLESLMSVPRKHWHQVLVMVDESHVFAPERSAGDAESTQAIISLMSQGRKRGFCGILATQRISKLHKDAAAECNNVCVGRTNLDIDLKRAADILGMTKSDAAVLRSLDPGIWYAFGPAFDVNGVVCFKAGAVGTKHPEAGKRHEFTAPAPSKAIQNVLGELEGLPAEAEKEVHDLATAKARIAELERAVDGKGPVIDVAALRDAEQHGYKAAIAEMSRKAGIYATQSKQVLQRMLGSFEDISRIAQDALDQMVLPTLDIAEFAEPRTTAISDSPKQRVSRSPVRRQPASTNGALGELPKAERNIIQALGPFSDGRTKVQIALLCGYSHKGGGFNNALSSLRSKGLIDGYGSMRATDLAHAQYGPFTAMPRGRELFDQWLRHSAIGKAERCILEALYQVAPRSITKEEVAELAGYEAKGGGFNNALSRLRTLELITRGREFTLNPDLLG